MINPIDSVKQFGVREGEMIADFGAGYGVYTYALAEAVKSSGRVFAVEIQKDLLSRLKKEASEKGIKNLEVIWGDIEVSGGSKLMRGAMDAVVIVNVLSQVESKAGVVRECARVLKNGGRVLVIDWLNSFGTNETGGQLIIDKSSTKNLFEAGPFEYDRDIDVGNQHYGVVFKKTGI